MADEKEPSGACRETIYNLFVYLDGGVVGELGAAAHQVEGTDEEKIAFLQSAVDFDHAAARRARLVRPVYRREFDALMRLGAARTLFNALPLGEALCLITPVVDGVPTFAKPDDPPDEDGEMVDWLRKYSSSGKLDVGQLLHDDHFVPIKLLFDARHYISAAKLLMSFVDTIAYVDLGDSEGIFVKWLDAYVDLAPLGLESRELWEYRNGLLHMSNLASRKVVAGKVAELHLYVGDAPESIWPKRPKTKYFSLQRLIDAIADGLPMWVSSFEGNFAKTLDFIDRYDLTVSDARLARKAIKR